MSGWLIAKPYEENAGLATHEVLFAVWLLDGDAALSLAKTYGPRGSNTEPRIIAEVSDSVLHGLRLQQGQVALLHADRPFI